MLSALFSFLGGSVFRMLWGEISSFITARQEHAQELDRMRLQGDLDKEAHDRSMEALKLQASLVVRTIEVQSEADVAHIEADSWLEGVKATAIVTGVRFIDAWNASIRPGVATWAIVMMTISEFHIISLSEFAAAVASAALGIYLADRHLVKRGK